MKYKIVMPEFVPEMVAHIRSKGKKVVSWNPGYSYTNTGFDMIQMWSSSGKPLTGVPTIDSRYHYVNHFDQFADIVGIYNSSIAGQSKGSPDYAGVIMCVWNDRVVKSDRDIVIQNAFYASMLAIAERSWIGGGSYIPTKGTLLNAPHTNGFIQFADWERRFLYHKANHLYNEPIAYVKQTNIQWRITDAFPNSGTLTSVFPPESQISDSYTFGGKTYGSRKAYGAGVYLRHVWGTLIPSFFSSPTTNSTAYAYTYVYSPIAQTAGAFIEFQNYGRSEADLAPLAGKWDYKESRIWLNDTQIPAPVWENKHTSKSNEVTLANENFSARPPISVQLKQGWNKVFMKLPVAAFSTTPVRLQKWMFTFVLVTPDGNNSLDNIIYSPEMNMNPSADILTSALDDAEAFINSTQIGVQPGEYPEEAKTTIYQLISEAKAIKLKSTEINEFDSVISVINKALDNYKKNIQMPQTSNFSENIWYTLHTPLRENRYLTSYGPNVNLKGDAKISGAASQMWKFIKLNDGNFAMINKLDQSYVSSASPFNSAIKGVTGSQTSKGWTITPTFTGLTFAISSEAVQLNQTGSGLGYLIYNWGGGSNLTDTGCRYQITEVRRVSTENDHIIETGNHFHISDGKIILVADVKKADIFGVDGRKLNINSVHASGIYILNIDGKNQKIIIQ